MSSAQAAGDPWLPAASNGGYVYRDHVTQAASSIVDFYARRYIHSDIATWCSRLTAGEIWLNGRRLLADASLSAGDRLEWHRPPWLEPAVPVLHENAIIFDDGDLLVFNKPSGLPVLPAGGFVKHTLLTQLEELVAAGRISGLSGLPRPVHRLGRFTSGLLVCARRRKTRAALSAQLRESTRTVDSYQSGHSSMKLYRALCHPLPACWAVGEKQTITVPIGKRDHALLGLIWCAAETDDSAALPSRSDFSLVERRSDECLVDIEISSGRPHQIRIHAASMGAPLKNDPLYSNGGFPDPAVLPGAGGYLLHAYRIIFHCANSGLIRLEAPLPNELCAKT